MILCGGHFRRKALEDAALDNREPMTLILKHPRGWQKQKCKQILFGRSSIEKCAKQKNEVGCVSTEEEAINSDRAMREGFGDAL